MIMMYKKYFGFTLAEVLIVLGVIGVVAALTIPTVINNANEAQTVSSLKKAYSTLSQAYSQAVQEYGTPEGWTISPSFTAEASSDFYNKLSPYLKVAKDCSADSGCFAPLYKNSNGDGFNYGNIDSGVKHKFVLTDGTAMGISVYYNDCSGYLGASTVLKNWCATVWVDINGTKAPNKAGHDLFDFQINQQGISPTGSALQDSQGTFNYCGKKNNFDLPLAGLGCTAWVIYNENMDYLKCSDLSWDGKHKCGG